MAQKQKNIVGVGRRKTSVASVHLKKGTGKVVINGKSAEEYFPLALQRASLFSPLQRLEGSRQYDIRINVKGGGIQGQVFASQLGIARALVAEDEDRRKEMKDSGYLTRDPRMKERKKYGRAKARKRFQFSKR